MYMHACRSLLALVMELDQQNLCPRHSRSVLRYSRQVGRARHALSPKQRGGTTPGNAEAASYLTSGLSNLPIVTAASHQARFAACDAAEISKVSQFWLSRRTHSDYAFAPTSTGGCAGAAIMAYTVKIHEVHPQENRILVVAIQVVTWPAAAACTHRSVEHGPGPRKVNACSLLRNPCLDRPCNYSTHCNSVLLTTEPHGTTSLHRGLQA